jgi:hypothetical protein
MDHSANTKRSGGPTRRLGVLPVIPDRLAALEAAHVRTTFGLNTNKIASPPNSIPAFPLADRHDVGAFTIGLGPGIERPLRAVADFDRCKFEMM